jgi:RimJ/RimL family protein N-acetyltransferase
MRPTVMQMPACLLARGFQSGDDECAARESPWLFAYRRPSEAFGRTFGEGKAIAWFEGIVPDESGAAEWVIWIRPDWRGRELQGKRIGAWVLEQMRELAREHGCKSIRAVIDVKNGASIGLHERLGFRLVAAGNETTSYVIDL